MPTEKPRVTFTIKQGILDKVDEFRYATKAKNQSQAILSLLEKGLEEAEQKTKKAPLYSSEAMDIARRYSGLEMAELDGPVTKPEPKIIPLFWSASAAGIASPHLHQIRKP